MKTVKILVLSFLLSGCSGMPEYYSHYVYTPPPNNPNLNWGTLINDQMECQNKGAINEQLTGMGGYANFP